MTKFERAEIKNTAKWAEDLAKELNWIADNSDDNAVLEGVAKIRDTLQLLFLKTQVIITKVLIN